jgi:hypothetical protein
MERDREPAAPAVAEDDDLEEHSPARRHGRGRRIWVSGRGRNRSGACGRGAGEGGRAEGGPRGWEIPPRVLGDSRRDWCAVACWLGKVLGFFLSLPLGVGLFPASACALFMQTANQPAQLNT